MYTSEKDEIFIRAKRNNLREVLSTNRSDENFEGYDITMRKSQY